MIRFRVGQQWKDEPLEGDGPTDAFRVEVDGLNLLPSSASEPLLATLGALLRAVSAVADEGGMGQVSFESSLLELCFLRLPDFVVEVSVVDLGAAPSRLKGPVLIELQPLVDATVRCVSDFLRDARAALRSGNDDAALAALEREAQRLSSQVQVDLESPEPVGLSLARTHKPGLGFVVYDVQERLARYGKKSEAALPPLLCEGALLLPGGAELPGLPFLQLTQLARAASQGRATINGQPFSPAAIFDAGLALCLSMRARNPALGNNPYLEALQLRCTEGLSALRAAVPDAQPRPSRPSAPRRESAVSPGSLRRLHFVQTWQLEPDAPVDDSSRILAQKGALSVTSPTVLQAFSPAGVARFRHEARRAVVPLGATSLLGVDDERVWYQVDRERSARWLRLLPTPALGPDAMVTGQQIVALAERRGVIAFDLLTGRERWRTLPLRTQRAHLARAEDRVLLATDGGQLLGLDAEGGQVRFRVRAASPCVHAPLVSGHRALAVLNRSEHTTVFLFEALPSTSAAPAGTIVWAKELQLASPAPPAMTKSRVWLAGTREKHAVVAALSATGKLLWERIVPVEARTLRLLPFGTSVIAADSSGAAIRLLPSGEAAWELAGVGDQLAGALPARLTRKLLLLPGPTLRWVDPPSGRIVSELPVGSHVHDVHVDRELGVTVLDRRLTRYEPRGLLSVML